MGNILALQGEVDMALADDEYVSFDVRFRVTANLENTGEPFEYVTTIEGDILRVSDCAPDVRLGCLRAHLVDVNRAADDKYPLFEVFDSMDDELAEYYTVLFDQKTDDFKEALFSDIEPMGSNVLIIDRMEISPQHRGRRFGLAALLRTIHTFGGGCALAVMNPFPLQFGSQGDDAAWCEAMQTRSFAGDKDAAIRKLQQYWAQFGFRRVVRSDILAFPLSRKLPTFEDIGLTPAA